VNALVLTLLAAAVSPAASPSVSAVPAAAKTEDVPALVKRCVAAYGGKAALARAAVTRQDGRVTSLLHQVSGPRLAAMILQAARLDLPALLSAWVAKVEDRGPGEVDGKPVRILSLQPAPGLVVQAEVEIATARVLRSRGTSTDPGMPLSFETTYGDFRMVDGVLVPFLEKNWANGRTTGETMLEKVTFPKSLPERVFKP
jgi:hypothetical protein